MLKKTLYKETLSKNKINNKLYYYIKILLFYNNRYNLVGILKEKKIINTCVLDSKIINSYINIKSKYIIEIGAGSGFLSIALSIMRPYIKFNLIESNRHKFYFLNKIIKLLKLKNVFIKLERIEKNIYLNKQAMIICRCFSKFSKFITISKNLSQYNTFITVKYDYKCIIKDKVPINYKIIKIQPTFIKLNKKFLYIIILLF